MADPTTESRSTGRLAIALMLLCFLLGLVGRGVGETMTVFLKPLGEAFDADRSAIAGILSVAMISGGIGSPLAGAVFDRFGPLRLYLAGSTILCLALLGASQASKLWHLYLCMGLFSGIAAAMIGNAPHTALLSRWFDSRLVTALGVVHSGLGIGTLAMVPLSQILIGQFGWRTAYMCLAGIVLLLVPILLLVPWQKASAGNPHTAKARTEAVAADDSHSLGSAMHTKAFWGLAATFFFTGSGVFSVVFQVVAYLIESGFEPLAAAATYGLVGFLVPAGMIGFASADRIIGPKLSIVISYFLTLLGIAMFWVTGITGSNLALVVAVIALGLTMGTRGPQVSSLAARIFRGRNTGVIIGAIMTGGSLGSGTGIFLGGLLHDLTGGYTFVFIYSLISICCGASPFFIVRVIRETHG